MNTPLNWNASLNLEHPFPLEHSFQLEHPSLFKHSTQLKCLQLEQVQSAQPIVAKKKKVLSTVETSRKKTKKQIPSFDKRSHSCYRQNENSEWHLLPQNTKIFLQSGDAWIVILSKFFEEVEINKMVVEDSKVEIRQQLLYSYGAHIPIRHLTGMLADKSVETMVSDYGTARAGQQRSFETQNIDNFPVTKGILNNLNAKATNFGDQSNTNFNSREILIYRPPSLPQSNVESMDHCSFHNGDGECMKSGMLSHLLFLIVLLNFKRDNCNYWMPWNSNNSSQNHEESFCNT